MKLKALALVGVMVLSGMLVGENVSAAVTCPKGSLRGDNNQTANSYAECNLPVPGKDDKTLMQTVQQIINVIVGVLGIVAVAVIILGGVYYVISQGEAAKITRAKNTILYGVVGLVVAMLAFAIVNFVMGSVFSSNTTTPSTTEEQQPENK